MRSGAFTVSKADTEHAFAKIRSRAAFELHCPASSVTLTVLDAEPDAVEGGWAKQIGASGCGQRVVYVRRKESQTPSPNDDWVMNTRARP